MRERSVIQDCSETLVKTAIIDTWMSVENVKKLWIAEKFETNIYLCIYIYINIYIYIYVYFNFLP